MTARSTWLRRSLLLFSAAIIVRGLVERRPDKLAVIAAMAALFIAVVGVGWYLRSDVNARSGVRDWAFTARALRNVHTTIGVAWWKAELEQCEPVSFHPRRCRRRSAHRPNAPVRKIPIATFSRPPSATSAGLEQIMPLRSAKLPATKIKAATFV